MYIVAKLYSGTSRGSMSKRLDALVDMVSPGKIVCDIGTDHGITAIKIYEEKEAKLVVATDISENSLQKLRDKLKGLDYNIITLVTDGIYELDSYNPQEIIISGMGGFLISQIIAKGIKVARKADKLILQANNSLDKLRRFLLENSFEIIDEKIVFDEGIYYDIIVASYKDGLVETYDKDYFYEYGKLIIEKKDPLLRDKLAHIKIGLESIRNNIKDINTESSLARIAEIDKELKIIEEVEACL